MLFPVAHLRRGVPPRLCALLADGGVWKAGAGVGADAAKLLADCGAAVGPLFDIAAFARTLGADVYPSPGLKGLCAAFGVALHKTKSVSLSDWAARPLRPTQKDYAAQDAFASYWLASQLHAQHGGGDDLATWLARHGSRGDAPVGVPRALPPAGAADDLEEGEV